MIFYITLIATSFFIGSTISAIVSKFIIFQKGLNFFGYSNTNSVPFFSDTLAKSKSYDFLEFGFTIILSLIFFFILFNINKNKKYDNTQALLVGLTNLLFAFINYLSISFAGYSGITTVISLVIFYSVTYLLLLFLPKKSPKFLLSKLAIYNGIAAGFYFLIIFNNLTTSIALPLAIFIETPIFFYLFSNKYSILKNPGFSLLILAFAFPFYKTILLIIGLLSLVVVFLTKKYFSRKVNDFYVNIYPLLILFIFLYNPLFYFGNFDSIEEGFWAGWLERLLQGQTIYRDFAAYHPPLLLYGLHVFNKLFGESLYNLRLYFHLLQIIGLTIFYYILKSITHSKGVRFAIFLIITAYCFGAVRNNMEIRLGSSILPIFIVYLASVKKKNMLLIIAGLASVAALLISIETGIASVLTTLFAGILFSDKKSFIRNISFLISGQIGALVIFLFFLFINGSFHKMIEYIVYYLSTFSSGYQNLEIERQISSTLIEWNFIRDYISSSGFVFQAAIFSIISALSILWVKKHFKQIKSEDKLMLCLTVIGLIISRSALGRSDAYHINFIWIVSLILIGYIIQFISGYSRIFAILILCFLGLFLVSPKIQNSFIQNQIIKYQTYGNPSGSYPSYSLAREGIITGIDINTRDTDSLINYINEVVEPNETIFVFPQRPEIYFLADRKNATSFDTPITFYLPKYQTQMINEIKTNQPKVIVYNNNQNNRDIINTNLYQVNSYIEGDYRVIKSFGDENILVRK